MKAKITRSQPDKPVRESYDWNHVANNVGVYEPASPQWQNTYLFVCYGKEQVFQLTDFGLESHVETVGSYWREKGIMFHKYEGKVSVEIGHKL